MLSASPPRPAKPQTSFRSATPRIDNPEEVERRAVVRQLRGPVAQRFRELLPDLAAAADPYQAIIGDIETLASCLRTFATRRYAFAEFLVDGAGTPVTDDAARLACGRSVNQVTGMAVRSAMRAYAEAYFTGVDAAGAPASDGRRAQWTAAIAARFRERRLASGGERPARDEAARFYAAIRDALDFGWQLQFFPVYVEIPPELFAKLGVGLTRLDSIEKLQRLAEGAADDIAKAEQVMGDPALTRDMIENNVLAAESVSRMNAEQFRTVNDALATVDTRHKWDVFANRLTALALGEDKRISKADIVALADYLHLLNVYALRVIFDLQLAREQMAKFLATATSALGRNLFMAVFGPLPFFGTDEQAAARQRGYATYIEGTLRGLVGAVNGLTARFSRDAPDLIAECLKLVCEARRDDIAAGIRKLAPAD